MLRLVLLCSCDIYVAVLQISLYCINIPYLSPHCFQRFCHMQALGITEKARSVSWPDVMKCDYIVFLFSSVLFCLSCECVFFVLFTAATLYLVIVGANYVVRQPILRCVYHGVAGCLGGLLLNP